MIRILPLVLLLAACGVDGAPVPPSQVEEKSPSGVTISGSAEFGIGRTF
jgi:hypothetical protein